MAVTNTTSPQVLETFALLQIAAEAFLNNTNPNDAAKPPTGSGSFDLTPAMLTRGNGHSSRMTDVAETPIRSNGSRFAFRCTLD